MLIKVSAADIFQKDYEWHSGRFHFEFGDYHDRSNQSFGTLCAFNDFVVQPQSGFEMHPHEEIEIISYCINGCLKHKDNMGNVNALRRGDSQYTCTGTGILHSEINEDSSTPLRFLQIWIQPEQPGLKPFYSENKSPHVNNGNLRCIASGEKAGGVLKIAQDAHVYAAEIEADHLIRYVNKDNRQSYAVCVEGELSVNGIKMNENDAMKIWGSDLFNFIARKPSHLIIVEMARG